MTRPEGYKKCRACGLDKSLDEFHPKQDMADGLQGNCRECQNGYMRKWRTRGNAKDTYRKTGGPYQVVYCPCNSFTNGSSFRRSEIAEMLDNEYLAIGTRFRHGIVVYEVSKRFTLQEVTA